MRGGGKTPRRRLFLSPPQVGAEELELVREAFASNYIAPLGPMVDRFEREFAERLGFRHAVALSSGTAAMHLAMRELGVGPGDEVWAATLTFIASISPAVHLGATPVFVDADPTTWTMDPDLLAEELAQRRQHGGRMPKLVVPTDLYGQPCDLARIRGVCDPMGIPVVEDAAEALGATRAADGLDIPAGRGATAAVYSFNGNKIITTSGGGMLASDDERLVRRARHLASQAREPAPHYEHVEIGYNYRLSNICAAIGCGQLARLTDYVARRRAIFDQYSRLLADVPGLTFMPEARYGRSSRWLTVVLIDAHRFGATPEQVRVALEQRNIESRPLWKPMHLQPVFRECRCAGGATSERLFRQGLCLPSGGAMTDADIAEVAEVVAACGRGGCGAGI